MHNAENAPQPPTASSDPLERRSFFWSMLGLGMLVLVSLTGAWTLRQVNQSDYWVDHTNEVLRYNEHVLNDIREAESAERGYIIAGDDQYLAPYEAAQRDLPESMQKLKKLTRDNPEQQTRLNALELLISHRLAVLSNALNQRRSGGFEASQKIVLSGQGLAVMQKIREVSSQVEAEELQLLQQRTQARQGRLRNGFVAIVAALVLALVALLAAPFDVRRAVRQRNVAARERAESESTAHALFETATQGILIVNESGRVIMANPSSAKMLGYEPEELTAVSIETLMPERFRSGHAGYRNGYFHDPQNRPMGIGRDLAARRKDESEFPAEISLSYIRTAQGVLAVAFLTDISKRKADEREIRQQREDLRQLTAQMMTAQDDERRRIARDLHDDLSQKLAFLAMDIGKLANKPYAAEFATELRPLQVRAGDAAMTVRKISHQLHPSVLDDIGLEAALEQYCDEFESRTGISTQFTSRNVPDPLSKEVASSLYHIAQECLRNTAKHSKSETVAVEIEGNNGVLRLTVKDQGVGLREQTNADRGIGMVAMKERANLVNGKVSIQSEMGEGTEVRVEVPVGA